MKSKLYHTYIDFIYYLFNAHSFPPPHETDLQTKYSMHLTTINALGHYFFLFRPSYLHEFDASSDTLNYKIRFPKAKVVPDYYQNNY